jgi:hypothetical protein
MPHLDPVNDAQSYVAQMNGLWDAQSSLQLDGFNNPLYDPQPSFTQFAQMYGIVNTQSSPLDDFYDDATRWG